MKKIGILTYHFALNCGAVLQCLALKSFIEKNTDNTIVEVINYQPKYHTNIYRPIINPFPPAYAFVKSLPDSRLMYKIYRFSRNVCASIIKSKNPVNRYRRRREFSKYITKHLELSHLCRTEDELRVYCNDYDLYITGSDQIWNSKVTNYSIDLQYFLKFICDKNNNTRISYAASSALNKSEINEVLPYLEKYNRISVREKKAYQELKSAGLENVRVDVDPTLLLCKEDYEKYESAINTPYDRYILFYGLPTDNRGELIDVLSRLKKATNLPIIDISPERVLKKADMYISVVNPGNFLSLIKNSTFVVTNSFHCSVFSILYTREFWCVLPRLHNERLTQLMSSLNLDDRIVTGDSRDFDKNIDWSSVNQKLSVLSGNSKKFLVSTIQGEL